MHFGETSTFIILFRVTKEKNLGVNTGLISETDRCKHFYNI